MSKRMSGGASELAFPRRRATYRLALILAGAAAVTSNTALMAADARRITITVRVYQNAGLTPMVEQRALAEAEAVLRAALVDVRWQDCTGPNVSAACHVPRGPSELLLRVIRNRTPRKSESPRLGDAFVARREGGGVLATVYVDHVAGMAKAAETDVAVLLGRVAAHELGHLIMDTSEHARRGLMRPNWTAGEVRRNSAVDWAFTAEDVAAMRQPGNGVLESVGVTDTTEPPPEPASPAHRLTSFVK
jgi:hypothetical protein